MLKIFIDVFSNNKIENKKQKKRNHSRYLAKAAKRTLPVPKECNGSLALWKARTYAGNSLPHPLLHFHWKEGKEEGGKQRKKEQVLIWIRYGLVALPLVSKQSPCWHQWLMPVILAT
jgi:hypothetical protein